MVKKWVLICLLSIFSVLTFSKCTNAISTAAQGVDGYINIKGRGNVFVDNFCNSSTASCSNDGKRCFCRPKILINSNYNQKCEFAFGSTLNYAYPTKNGTPNLKTDPEVILSGGIWTKIAKTCDSSSKGIVFKKVKKNDDKDNTYSSNFIKNLYSDSCVDKWMNEGNGAITDFVLPTDVDEVGVELNIDIDNFSARGTAYNQTFYIVKNGQRHRCAIREKNITQAKGTKKNSLNNFFLKGSEFNLNPNEKIGDVNNNYCSAPAVLMLASVFNSRRSNAITRNCTTDTGDGTWKFVKEIFDTDNGNNLDMQKAASNLIVYMDDRRTVYFSKPENFFYNEVFDKTNNKKERKKQVENIRKTYEKECGDSSKINLNCDESITFNYVADELEKHPEKSYTTIVADAIVEGDDSAAKVCDLINGSWDNINEKEDEIEKMREKGNEKEQKLNDTISTSVLYFCNSSFPRNSKKRIKCKETSSNCYNLLMTEAESIQTCEDIAKDKNLSTTKWLICPPVNTSLGFYQSLINAIIEIFETPINFSTKDKFQETMKKFIALANILLGLFFLIMIFSQLTNIGLSNYQIKVFLPKFILAVILVNISLFVCQLAIDISNIAGHGIVDNIDILMEKILDGTTTDPTTQSVARSVFNFDKSIAGMTIVLIIIFSIPFIILGLVGLFIGYTFLAIREGLVVILSVLTPLALLASLSPKTKKAYDMWYKHFLSLLLAFPISALLVKSAQLTQVIFTYISAGEADSSSMMKLVGIFLPGISLLLLPFIIKKITKSLINITSVANFTKKHAKNISKNSYFSQAYKDNLYDTTAGNILNSEPAKKVLSSKFINKPTFGGGINILNSQRLRNAKFTSDYERLIAKDPKLLEAFIQEGESKGLLYNSLNDNQKYRYNSLLSLKAHNDPSFYNSVAGMMVDCKKIDAKTLKIAGDKGIDNGLNEEVFKTSLFLATKKANKKGLSAISGSLNVAQNNFENERFGRGKDYKDVENPDHPIQKTDISRFKNILDPNSINIINEFKENGTDNINDEELEYVVDFATDKLPIILETTSFLEKAYPENIALKDFDLTYKSSKDSMETSILATAITYKLSEHAKIEPDSSGKYTISKAHYINKLGKSWNFMAPGVRAKIEPLIIKFAKNNPTLAKENFTSAESVFKALNINSKEIPL